MAKKSVKNSTEDSKPKQDKWVKQYIAAFRKAFDGAKDGFEIKLIDGEDGAYKVKYENTIYEIHSYSDLLNYQLDNWFNTDYTQSLPGGILHLAFGDFHTHPYFHSALLDEIDITEKGINKLSVVISLTKISRNPAETFWRSLESLDKMGLYAKAIVAVFRATETNITAKKLLDVLLKHRWLPLAYGAYDEVTIINLDGVKDQFIIFPNDDADWDEE